MTYNSFLQVQLALSLGHLLIYHTCAISILSVIQVVYRSLVSDFLVS